MHEAEIDMRPFWIFNILLLLLLYQSSLKHLLRRADVLLRSTIVLLLSILYSTDKSLVFVLLVLVLLESRSSNGRLSGREALGRGGKSCSDNSCASVNSFGIKIPFRNNVFLPIWVLAHALASKRRRPIVRRYCDGTSTDCRKRRHLVLLRETPSAS